MAFNREIDENCLLIGRTNHDKHTSYPYAWTELVLDKARKQSWRCIDLKKENFTRENFEGNINEASIIVLCGHGDEFSAKGWGDKIVLESCVNDGLVEGRITYVPSCKTAQVLGQSSINKGCSGYVGYLDEFKFRHEVPIPKKLTEDRFAKAFMELWINYWRKRPERTWIIDTLLKDKDSLCFLVSV